jgi:hypothetical protein
MRSEANLGGWRPQKGTRRMSAQDESRLQVNGKSQQRVLNTLVRVATFILLIAALVRFSTGASVTTSQDSIAGKYSIGTEYSGSTITIDSSNSFQIDSSDCTTEYREAGKYLYSSGLLIFTPLIRTTKSHGATEDHDVFSPEGFREVYNEDPPKDFNKPYSYVVVKWAERRYLISVDSIIQFCNAVNLGIEPRSEISVGADYFGSFYLREGDEPKPVSGRPEIPKASSSYLLDTPVETRVTRIEGEGVSKVAFVDKGTKDGLKVEMILSYRNRSPSLFSGIKILAVGENWAKVVGVEGLKSGDILCSRVKPYFERYGELSFEMEKVRLDEFAKELEEQWDMVAYIVVYGGQQSSNGETQILTERAREYLINVKGIEADRIIVIEGGKDQEPTTELCLRRFDKPPPVPNPRPRPEGI